MARKKYQAYTKELRREAVKRSEKEAVSTATVANELGISPSKFITGGANLIVFQINCLIPFKVLIILSRKAKSFAHLNDEMQS